MKIGNWEMHGGTGVGLRIARIVDRVVSFLGTHGALPDYFVTLEVAGRKTGRIQAIPLVVAIVDGERYIVSMLGENVGWVRNLKASDGRAVIRRGRVEEVRLEEVPVEKRARILKPYLKRAVGARPHIPVDKDAPLAEFEKIAPTLPVYRVVPV